MTEIDILNGEISAFYTKYDKAELDDPDVRGAYIADAEAIIGRHPPRSDEERRALAGFYSHLGCMITVFGQQLETGIGYYRKSLELDPGSYDLRWEYYTTLEEIVEDRDLAAPELIRDAIDCLTFCIDYCDTPELQKEKYIHYRYNDLGRVYMAAGDHRKAKECFERSMRILPNDNARKLLAQADLNVGNALVRFFKRLFARFRR